MSFLAPSLVLLYACHAPSSHSFPFACWHPPPFVFPLSLYSVLPSRLFNLPSNPIVSHLPSHFPFLCGFASRLPTLMFRLLCALRSVTLVVVSLVAPHPSPFACCFSHYANPSILNPLLVDFRLPLPLRLRILLPRWHGNILSIPFTLAFPFPFNLCLLRLFTRLRGPPIPPTLTTISLLRCFPSLLRCNRRKWPSKTISHGLIAKCVNLYHLAPVCSIHCRLFVPYPVIPIPLKWSCCRLVSCFPTRLLQPHSRLHRPLV